jgi:hypothetical protein
MRPPTAARRPRHAVRVGLVALAAASLMACQASGDPQAAGGFAGATTGTVTTALTANPALGIAVGIGTRALVDAGVAHAGRRQRRAEQDALAATVGAMQVGEARAWQVPDGWLLRERHGEVRVLRATETKLASCKEVAFSLTTGETGTPARRWFVTTACRRQAQDWKWATAEPATSRWGSLQ